jgi:peptidoglycan/LPS O-acetylase OafA/YrhL
VEQKLGAGVPKIGVVNGLRGLAILLVVLHHLLIPYTGPDALYPGEISRSGWLAAIVNNATLGVDVFFVLSGFVLYLPYCTGRRRVDGAVDFQAFYLHRAKRLLPLYFLIVLVTMALHSKALAGEPKWYLELGALLSTLFIYSPHGFLPPSNVVLWSVSVEIWFSVVFPMLVVLIQKWKIEKVLLLSLAACLVFMTAGTWIRIDRVGNFLPFTRGLFGNFYEFVLGMFVCQLYVRRLGSPAAKPWQSRSLIPGLLLAWGCLYVSPMLSGTVPLYVANRMLVMVGAALVLLGLLSGESLLRKALENRPLQVLGCMCYSIYAWHSIVLTEMIPSTSHLSYTLRLTLPFLLMTAAISALSYRYIEFGHERNWKSLFLLGGAKGTAAPATSRAPQ